jgi:hypothetical protein
MGFPLRWMSTPPKYQSIANGGAVVEEPGVCGGESRHLATPPSP